MSTHKHSITIKIDTSMLGEYTDPHLAALWHAILWHVTQANPTDGVDTNEPNEIAERVGREIIRRWLGSAPTELPHRSPSHPRARRPSPVLPACATCDAREGEGPGGRTIPAEAGRERPCPDCHPAATLVNPHEAGCGTPEHTHHPGFPHGPAPSHRPNPVRPA